MRKYSKYIHIQYYDFAAFVDFNKPRLPTFLEVNLHNHLVHYACSSRARKHYTVMGTFVTVFTYSLQFL